MDSFEKLFPPGVIVSSLTEFLETDFNTQRENWEKALLAELKLTEVGHKATKKTMSGMSWPTLSLERKAEVRIAPLVTWKKAATTYVTLNGSDIEAFLTEDMKSGVRNFFFYEEALDEDKWRKIEALFSESQASDEIEVFTPGTTSFKSKFIKPLITGSEAHDQGGHSVQELAFLLKNVLGSQGDEIFIGVYVDSQFFHNIAKIRAARLLVTKLLQETGNQASVKIVALTSYQGWTLFERYSNMLRNETAVASSYIGGADHVQSAGYNSLIELEAQREESSEHSERSRRMARNTTHILSLESMLGVVEDAAHGSYHLENLTQMLCEESWKLMQRLLKGEDIGVEIGDTRNQRLQMIKTRKNIVSGINEYPDVKEKIALKLKAPKVFRAARIFEELRLKMEGLKKPEVYIALYGDYGALNARLNFVKNYFELLGLTVHDNGHSVLDSENFKKNLLKRKEEIIVVCAADDHYPILSTVAREVNIEHKYIAGKFEMASYKNLFAGQNVYEILLELVQAFEGRKS
jgi:Methylmalonyl-CoA mutase